MTSECIIGEGETSKGEFIFFNEANITDYEGANRKCKEIGAILAPVKTWDFMEKIVNFLKPCDRNSWLIGIKYDNDNVSGVWSDGKPYKESEHLSIIPLRRETNPKCVVLRKSSFIDSFWLMRSPCKKKRFICFRQQPSLPQTPSSEITVSSTTESNKFLDDSEKKKPTPKTKSKIPTITTSKPVPKTNKRTIKRITTTKSFVSNMTSPNLMTSPSSRTNNITSQTTTTPSSFFTNVTSNPTLLYSLIGGAAFLLLIIFLTTFFLCKKSKKKKKRKASVGGEDVEMTDKLYQDTAQVADTGLDGHQLTDGDEGNPSDANKQFVYENLFSRDASNAHGSTNADVYAQITEPNDQGQIQVPEANVYDQIMEPNGQGQVQIPECYVYDQVVTPKYRT